MKRNNWQWISDDHVWFYPPDVWLSTVELPGNFYKDAPYESCIFFANGESEVLKRYKTKEDAARGHIEYERQYNLKRIKKNV
jgi:hypothetical protein